VLSASSVCSVRAPSLEPLASTCGAMGACTALQGAPQADQGLERRPAAMQTLYSPGHQVHVATTSFGVGLPGVRAYHSSVRVDDLEYSFGNDGVVKAAPYQSHQNFANQTKVVYLGLTRLSGDDLMQERLLRPLAEELQLVQRLCHLVSLGCAVGAKVSPNGKDGTCCRFQGRGRPRLHGPGLPAQPESRRLRCGEGGKEGWAA